MTNQKDKFDDLTNFYQTQDWINEPNIFAKEVLQYLPKNGKMLCLGDGQGQDSRFFAKQGYVVTATDLSDKAVEINKEKSEIEGLSNIKVEKLDMLQEFPYQNGTFDIVYAHLSLHYFDIKSTQSIVNRIFNVLKNGGMFCVFTNSINDPEYATGKKIEPDYLNIEGVKKRFFSVESMKTLMSQFETILADDRGETYKDSAKGIHNLIRFVGKKPNK